MVGENELVGAAYELSLGDLVVRWLLLAEGV
jgi:hypothetical protein